jgi:hypothetical protein
MKSNQDIWQTVTREGGGLSVPLSNHRLDLIAHARNQITDQGTPRARAMLAQTPNHDLFSQE